MSEVKSSNIGLKATKKRYGVQLSPTYSSWCEMKRRCNKPNRHNYQWYGGRGIKVCDRWNKSFLSFLEDMGEKPSAKYSIDRINNEGNYTPDNCKWSSKQEQSLNRRPRSNKSGYTGVTWHNGAKKWAAEICRKGQRMSLGYYQTPVLASLAYERARKKLDAV